MKYFTIKELSKSQVATKWGFSNTPGDKEKDNLTLLVDNVLDPAREELGMPVIVLSGYRCSKVNELVGGASKSQHMKGQAADVQTAGDLHNVELFKALSATDFDQLIWEFGSDDNPDWIHVSYNNPEGNRHQILKSVKDGGKTIYMKMKLS